MTEFQKVKDCWSKIKSEKGSNAFVDKFYQILFKNYPETHELFPKDINTQKRKLLSTLDNVINGLEHIDAIRSELLDLGRHHKNLGITNEMYDAFIITIVGAADFAANSSLTQDERTAWKVAYRKMSDIMLEAC